MYRLPVFLVLLLLTSIVSLAADEEIFSGPQVDEKLVPFKIRGILGEGAGEEIDLVAQADGKPVVIFFVHEVTRPSVGLTRMIMDYAALRAKDGLHGGVVFLSDDPTDTENWMKRASHALPKGMAVGISSDGREGPGAYGLNRNVAVTVLVAKENKITANYALVQPSIQADAPKIAKSIVDVLGGGAVPTLAELGARGYSRAVASDPKLDALLRKMIQKTATPDDVKQAAEAIESYIADKKPLQADIGSRASRIVNSGKLENYGTAPAHEQLKAWAKKYGADSSSKRD